MAELCASTVTFRKGCTGWCVEQELSRQKRLSAHTTGEMRAHLGSGDGRTMLMGRPTAPRAAGTRRRRFLTCPSTSLACLWQGPRRHCFFHLPAPSYALVRLVDTLAALQDDGLTRWAVLKHLSQRLDLLRNQHWHHCMDEEQQLLVEHVQW